MKTKLNHYTIKVKKRIFWKTYKAVAHAFKSTAGNEKVETWLEIQAPDGAFHYVTRIDSRDWMVYPDYSEFISQKTRLAKKKASKEVQSLTDARLQEMAEHANAISAQVPEFHS